MDTRTLGQNLEVSALGLGCMGMSSSFPPFPEPAGDGRAPPDRRRPGGDLLRYGAGLRPVHERGARRRGARAGPRPGRDRDQVRLRALDGRVPRRRQPPGDDQAQRRRVAEAASHRQDRPALPAPRRPERPDRGCRRDGQGADRGGEGRPLRPLRGGGADDPPSARGTARDRAAERVLALVAGAGGCDPPDARGARDRARPVQPAREGLPDRDGSTRRRRSRAATSATRCRVSRTSRRARRTVRSSTC